MIANPDIWFRIGCAVLLVSAVLMSGYFRTRANRLGGRLPSNHRLIVLRLVGLLCVLPVAVFLIYPEWVSWARVPLPTWLRWLGLGGGWLSLFGLFQVLRALGGNITPVEFTRSEHLLVTSGPYRWIRHPLYTFGACLWISVGMAAALWPVFAGISLAAVLLGLRTPREEQELENRFGQLYIDYKKKTGRYFPRLVR